MKVKKLLEKQTQEVVTISPDASVYDALQLIADKKIDVLVVVEKEKVVGMLSKRNVTRKMILKKKKSKKAKLPSDAYYVPRLQWTQNSDYFCVIIMNRHQNNLKILRYNAKNGKHKVILEEKDKRYINLPDHFYFLKDNKHFTLVSEKNGYNHIYLYDNRGRKKKQVTKGRDFHK